ncbi:hypothetical protein ACH5RR_032077 [Cinchona calisaya]|uniref:Uncharacterized protein n=1 Tax=Cinchona calisaya TaxID=153742 RepID=A0ABD2YLB0_9GENT
MRWTVEAKMQNKLDEHLVEDNRKKNLDYHIHDCHICDRVCPLVIHDHALLAKTSFSIATMAIEGSGAGLMKKKNVLFLMNLGEVSGCSGQGERAMLHKKGAMEGRNARGPGRGLGLHGRGKGLGYWSRGWGSGCGKESRRK